jgi:hypothetical protein
MLTQALTTVGCGREQPFLESFEELDDGSIVAEFEGTVSQGATVVVTSINLMSTLTNISRKPSTSTGPGR